MYLTLTRHGACKRVVYPVFKYLLPLRMLFSPLPNRFITLVRISYKWFAGSGVRKILTIISPFMRVVLNRIDFSNNRFISSEKLLKIFIPLVWIRRTDEKLNEFIHRVDSVLKFR